MLKLCGIHDIEGYSPFKAHGKICERYERVRKLTYHIDSSEDEQFIIGVAKLVKGAAVQMLSPKYKGFVGSSPTTGALTFYNLLCS